MSANAGVGWQNSRLPAYLQLVHHCVKAIEYCLTQQSGLLQWRNLIHHKLPTKEGQYLWEVLGVPVVRQ